MAHPIRPDYGQTSLFPYSLGEFVASEHLVGLIGAFVDGSGGLGFYGECGGFGRPRYFTNLFLKRVLEELWGVLR